MAAKATPVHGDDGLTLFDDLDFGKNEAGGYFLREDCLCEAPYLAGDPWRLDDDEDGCAEVSRSGLFTLFAGFKWDGPSVPDSLRWFPGLLSDNFIGPSGFHDAVARKSRTAGIDYHVWKPRADRLLVGLGKIEGMWWLKRAAIAEAMHTDKAWRAFRPQPATDSIVYVLP